MLHLKTLWVVNKLENFTEFLVNYLYANENVTQEFRYSMIVHNQTKASVVVQLLP